MTLVDFYHRSTDKDWGTTKLSNLPLNTLIKPRIKIQTQGVWSWLSVSRRVLFHGFMLISPSLWWQLGFSFPWKRKGVLLLLFLFRRGSREFEREHLRTLDFFFAENALSFHSLRNPTHLRLTLFKSTVPGETCWFSYSDGRTTGCLRTVTFHQVVREIVETLSSWRITDR